MRVLTLAPLILLLAACGSLPHDGPSARSVPEHAAQVVTAKASSGQASYVVVDLDYAASQQIINHPPAPLLGLAQTSSSAPTDLIGEGDVLAIDVLDVGGGLFSPNQDSSGAASQLTYPRIVVDSAGDISVPFGGEVHVAGLRPRQAADAVRVALRGRDIDPQVTLSVADSRANSVTVIGEVKNTGHFPLSAHNDRLLDALASAGGPTRPTADLDVVIVRGATSADAPLDLLLSEPSQNIHLAPQDQVRVVYKPRKFMIFGALGRPGEDLIEDSNLTLAAALGMGSGLDTNTANADAVMLFRFERVDVAAALGVTLKGGAQGVPIVYRLNMRNAASMFVANNFSVQSGDILYVPRSDVSELQKFFSLVNSVTQVGYNVQVTRQIN